MTLNRLILDATHLLFQKFPNIEKHSIVLLYGSAMNGKGFRDIDLLVVSNNINDILVQRYFVDGKVVNAYIINRVVLERDIVDFTKGQFYSYKFAFGVELVHGSEVLLRNIFKKFVCQTLKFAEDYLKVKGTIKTSPKACTIKQVVARILLYRLCIDKSFFTAARRLCSLPELLQDCTDRYQRILTISNTEVNEFYELNYKNIKNFIPSPVTILRRYWMEYFRRQSHINAFQKLFKTVKKFYLTRPHSSDEYENLYKFLYNEATNLD